MTAKNNYLNKRTAATYAAILIGLSAASCQHHQFETFSEELSIAKSPSVDAMTVQANTPPPKVNLEQAISSFQKDILLIQSTLNDVATAQGETLDTINQDIIEDISLEEVEAVFMVNEPLIKDGDLISEEHTSGFKKNQGSLNDVPRSVLKAMLIVKSLRDQIERVTAPSETDLDEDNIAKANELIPYLNKLEEMGISLENELSTNFYLKQIDALEAVKSGIELIAPDPSLVTEAEKPLLTLIGYLNPLDLEINTISEEVDAAHSSPEKSIDMAAFANDDEKLSKAEKLGKKGNLREAIDLLESIQGSSALYDPAQALIKSFSDKGVKELRRKAAQAFQSALPLPNTEDQLEYFKTAKNYLEEARVNYPGSSQLEIVEKNLKMISRKILQSEPEVGGGSDEMSK